MYQCLFVASTTNWTHASWGNRMISTGGTCDPETIATAKGHNGTNASQYGLER